MVMMRLELKAIWFSNENLNVLVMQVRRKDGLIQKFWFVLIMYDFLFTRGKLFLRMEAQGFLSKSISSKYNCIGP